MKLLVGLGNPEKRYDKTYHNIGFMVVDKFAKTFGVSFDKKKHNAVFGEFLLNGEKILVAKPQTYMNLSGNSVLSFKSKYKLQNKDIFVVVDDIDLPLGTYRFRVSGSGGTHNGMRNIVSLIGPDFPRLRIGIGKSDNRTNLADFVLQKISAENLEVINEVINEVVGILKEKLEAQND